MKIQKHVFKIERRTNSYDKTKPEFEDDDLKGHTTEEKPIRGSPRRLEFAVIPRFMKKESMGMTKRAKVMLINAEKVDKN